MRVKHVLALIVAAARARNLYQQAAAKDVDWTKRRLMQMGQ